MAQCKFKSECNQLRWISVQMHVFLSGFSGGWLQLITTGRQHSLFKVVKICREMTKEQIIFKDSDAAKTESKESTCKKITKV